MGAAFAGDDMCALMRQNLVAGPAMHQRRGDIAHGAGRHEHGGLFAEQFGHTLAQQVHGRVVADLLVADLGACDRLAHAGCRPGLGVRQQVDADRPRFRVARRRRVGHDGFSILCKEDDGEGDYLNRRFSRESWSIDVHPISFIPRSTSARIRPSARSTPAWPAAARG